MFLGALRAQAKYRGHAGERSLTWVSRPQQGELGPLQTRSPLAMSYTIASGLDSRCFTGLAGFALLASCCDLEAARCSSSAGNLRGRIHASFCL